MDAKSQNFQTNSVCLWSAGSRYDCILPQSSSFKIFYLDSRSTSYGNECVLSKLELPFSLIKKWLQKIIKDKATVLLITPVWQCRPWYPMLLNLPYNRPLLLPHNSQILKLPGLKSTSSISDRKFCQPSGLSREIF